MKKHRIKNTFREIARHLGLKVKYVDYLKEDEHGKLLPREKRILINAHKSRNEHIYTLLHEVGHYLLHFKSLPRKHHPRIFDIQWKAAWLARFNSHVRRYFRFIFNKQTGKEWEADVWAMCAFIYFAKRLDCRDELLIFLDRHPEKTTIFLLTAFGTAYIATKQRLHKFGRALATPFRLLRA